MNVKRIREIESGTGADVTITEVYAMAKALNVHPFTLLWPGDIKDGDLKTIDDFFKTVIPEPQMGRT